jgi:cell shape-determining protein MreD
MNWVVFAIGAWIMLGFEQGLKGSLQLGGTTIAPSFLAVYAVFIACSAPPRAAQWGCLVIGALIDVSSPIARIDGGPDFMILGPNALGSLLMCQLVLALRGLMFRRNPLTLAFLSCAGFALWQVVVTAMLTIRHLGGDPTAWFPSAELGSRLGSSVFTGLIALPVSLILIVLMPLFAFQYIPYRLAHRR